MPPPFKLENIHVNPMDLRQRLTLYCKKTYVPTVKITGWDKVQCSQPFDRNPLCPYKYNLFRSHYNNLGSDYDLDWSTTTGDMLKEVFTRRKDLEINPNKTMVSVYSAIDIQKKKQTYDYDNCYTTTMQSSFPTPCPYTMKGLTLADPPFLQNRKFSHIPKCKFLDDTYIRDTKDLQTHKMFRHVSYNSNTNKFTDGSPGYTEENKCYDLKFYRTNNDPCKPAIQLKEA